MQLTNTYTFITSEIDSELGWMDSLLKLSVVVAGFSLTAAQTGTAGCPCLVDPPVATFVIPAGQTGEGLLSARPDGTTVIPYPVEYGTNCAAHDVETEPYCADATGAALTDDPTTADTDESAPSWCTSEWCWIDPASCDLDNDPSSYFHIDGVDATLYYSYTTCSSENTFTDSATDAQACNDQHSTVVASHCTPAVTEDARCPCINWADEPATRAPFENTGGTALLVTLEGTQYEYALGYGSGACAAHDSNHAPYCADATGAPLTAAPDWCQSAW